MSYLTYLTPGRLCDTIFGRIHRKQRTTIPVTGITMRWVATAFNAVITYNGVFHTAVGQCPTPMRWGRHWSLRHIMP